MQKELMALKGEKAISTKHCTPIGATKLDVGARVHTNLTGEIFNEHFSSRDLKILDIYMKLSTSDNKMWLREQMTNPQEAPQIGLKAAIF